MLRQPTSRRDFLRGSGALVVTLSLAGAFPVLAEAAPLAAAQAPPPLDPTQLDSYLKIGGDGTVTAYTSKVELGQGNRTALSQIVAEDLDVSFGTVELVMGDTAQSIQEFGTDGSRTIADAGSNLRVVAAEARKTLVDLAASQWNVSAASLVLRDGLISKADGSASVTYAQLIGDKHFNVDLKALTAPDGSLVPFTTALSGSATPKNPSQYQIVGTSVPRVDIPPKVTGQFTYLQDVRVPGMLHGRVVRPTGVHSNLVGPSCAVADVQGDRATIHSAAQNSFAMKASVAKILGLPDDNVHVMHVEASGCYGLNGADDVTTDAALMSQLVGRPVRVQYMRQDEHRWEPKGPAMLHDFRAGLDDAGNVVAYGHTAWVPPNFDSTSLTGSLVGMQIGFPCQATPELGDRSAVHVSKRGGRRKRATGGGSIAPISPRRAWANPHSALQAAIS
jgi:CO/xanthine dehydrogenase Mo-binding subunit